MHRSISIKMGSININEEDIPSLEHKVAVLTGRLKLLSEQLKLKPARGNEWDWVGYSTTSCSKRSQSVHP